MRNGLTKGNNGKPYQTNDDDLELYKKYRPKLFKDVVGQDSAVRMLKEMVDNNCVPHALMFVGPSGCGKTTLARIMQKKLKCSDSDYTEVDFAAVEKPLEEVRTIKSRCGLRPMNSPCRIYYFDEVQALSKAGFAQQAMLKILEDTPRHVYFFLATTDPGKLLPTIKTRCTEIKVASLTVQALEDLVKSVCDKEKVSHVSDEVVYQIANHAWGSPRKALVLLHQVIKIKGEQEQLECISRGDAQEDGYKIFGVLMNPRSKWPDVVKIIKDMKQDPETVRHIILASCRTVMHKGGQGVDRAARIAGTFRDHWYDCPEVGLELCCWEVLS